MLVLNVGMSTKNFSLRMTPFDFLKLVHDKKIKWDDLTEDEQKSYNKFIINRALGFNNNMLDIVNRIQSYDISPKESFKYYQNMTGDKFRFNKWIKGSKTNSFKPELLEIVSKYLECSSNQAKDYLNILEKKEIKNNVLKNEPHKALFVKDNNPLIFYDKIAELAKNHLTKNGLLFFEINQYLGKETVELIRIKGFNTIELKKDIFGNDRIIIASVL